MKFLVVVPKFVGRPEQYYIFPLGLAYVSAALKSRGYSVECLNLNLYDVPPSQLIPIKIIEKRIDFLCTGGLSAHYAKVKEILDFARKAKPDITTIVGGGLLSSEPELMMRALGADFGVIGEGEETILELANALSNSQEYSSINGLIYRQSSGGWTTTSPRLPIQDIDSIPYPDYEGFEISKYLDMRLPNDERDLYPSDQPRPLFIISSRSCPYSCTFCYHPLGKMYRQRSLDSLFAEMEHWIKKYSINIFFIMDELFSLNRQRVVEFCKRIKPLGVKWQVQIRVDNVDKEMLAMMRDAGCYCISYGLESGSDIVLESMQKHIKVSQVIDALELTYEARIGVQGNFIFGDAAETKETAAETMGLWLKLKKHNVYMVPIEMYPGTEIYHNAVAAGIISDKLEFIAKGCYSINITKMSEPDYGRVLLLMYLLRESYQAIPARVLSCWEEGIHPFRGDVYAVQVLCPHCGSIVEYRNMSPLGYLKLGCRVCDRRFDLPPLNRHSVWPPNYVVASQYSFSDSHAEEIKKFLSTKNQGWPNAVGILDKRSTTQLKIVRLFGKYYLFPRSVPKRIRSLRMLSFSIVRLLGRHYLIPRTITPDDIRSFNLPSFLVDIGRGVGERMVMI
jgi:radical SAM superfamily enzyme YgiQ (UPF0313 family)